MNAAERKRAERARKAQGLAQYRLWLPEHALAEALIEAGHLPWDRAEDHAAIEVALQNAIAEQIVE